LWMAKSHQHQPTDTSWWWSSSAWPLLALGWGVSAGRVFLAISDMEVLAFWSREYRWCVRVWSRVCCACKDMKFKLTFRC
jgi:hypothetical protein